MAVNFVFFICLPWVFKFLSIKKLLLYFPNLKSRKKTHYISLLSRVTTTKWMEFINFIFEKNVFVVLGNELTWKYFVFRKKNMIWPSFRPLFFQNHKVQRIFWSNWASKRWVIVTFFSCFSFHEGYSVLKLKIINFYNMIFGCSERVLLSSLESWFVHV